MRLDKPYLGVLLFCLLLSRFPIAMPETFHVDEEKNPLFISFPYELGGWKGKDSEVDERTYEILETRNVLSRYYENTDGIRMHLLLVGSRKDRRVAHPPEVCYLSSNYIIVDEKGGQFQYEGAPLELKTFLAKNERQPNHQEQVVYLYKVGGRYTTNYYSQQLQFAMDRFAKREAEVLLIRLAIVSDNATLPKNSDNLFQEILPLILDQINSSKK